MPNLIFNVTNDQQEIPTFLMTSLRKIISVSFIVRSSSLVPDFRSLTTEGRMQRGGTRSRVRMRSAGFPASGFISSSGMSSWGILLNKFSTTSGFRFSWKTNYHNGKVVKKNKNKRYVRGFYLQQNRIWNFLIVTLFLYKTLTEINQSLLGLDTTCWSQL